MILVNHTHGSARVL